MCGRESGINSYGFLYVSSAATAAWVAVAAVDSLHSPTETRLTRFDSPPGNRDSNPSQASPYTGTAAPLVAAAPSLQRNAIMDAISPGSTHES